MAVSEISGIAGTVSGGGGVSNQGFERFAEMMLRMREAKQQEAAQKLDTSFKIFDATGMMPSESDLKGPLKELGVTLTPEMMDQFAQRGQELRTTRAEAAKTQVAQRHAAEATAQRERMDVEKQQAKLELGQRLSQAGTDDERQRITQEGIDKGLISLKDISDIDQFKMQIRGLPAEQQTKMIENYDRHIAGMFSTDQLEKNTRDEAAAAAQDAATAKYRADQLDIQQQGITLEKDRIGIERAGLALRQKQEAAQEKVDRLHARAGIFKAIGDFMKENRSTAMDAMKELQIAKKAGYPIPPELEKRIGMQLAKSYLDMEITKDLDGEPLGLEALEKLSVGEVPAGITHPIDYLLGRTHTEYLFEPIRKGPAGIDAAAGEGSRDEDQFVGPRKPPPTRAQEVGSTIGSVIAAPFPGSPLQRALKRKTLEAGEAGIRGAYEGGKSAIQQFMQDLSSPQ